MACLRRLHPADENPTAIRCQQGLGRIEIQPVVQAVELRALEEVVFFVVAASDIGGVVPVVELQPLGQHLHRRNNQDVCSFQGKEIGALPHFPILVPAAVQGRDILPLQRIFAAEEDDGAAAVLRAAAHHGVKAVFLSVPPELRVPEVLRTAAIGEHFRRNDRVIFIFLIILPIAKGDALGLAAVDKAVLPLPLLHSGIHQQMPPVRQSQGAARKDAGVVILLVGGHGRREPLPADQIL